MYTSIKSFNVEMFKEFRLSSFSYFREEKICSTLAFEKGKLKANLHSRRTLGQSEQFGHTNKLYRTTLSYNQQFQLTGTIWHK